MKITPIEIKKQEFKKTMRGYDVDEVDAFLDIIAREYESLIELNSQMEKENSALMAELKHFKDVEKTLKQTLYNVQQTSQLSKENSQKEATLVKKEAELAAVQLLDKSRIEVQKMKDEVSALRQQKESFVSRLRHLLSSQIELIDVLSMDDKDTLKAGDKGKVKQSTPEKPVEKAQATTTKPVQEKKEAAAQPQSQPKSTDGAKDETKEKNKDFFKDIFGDNLDVDEILK